MARRKISEYRAKEIINTLLGIDYVGWPIVSSDSLPKYGKYTKFVVKVDQAVKQRFKKGLVFLEVAKKDISEKIDFLRKQGYSSILIEPYVTHDGSDERYFSFRRERHGVSFSYSMNGGVDIEANKDSIQSGLFDELDILDLVEQTGLTVDQLKTLRRAFDELHLTLLEVNPYVLHDGKLIILDVAMEVDATAELLVNDWNESDMRSPAAELTQEEKAVQKLNKESPASFSLEVIHPDGSIFLLLSGGGASVVIADEIHTLGYGKELANYGEYSGNPTEDEAYTYTDQVLQLLLRSKAKQKVLLVGGAVANFTDIATTFRGVIGALEKNKTKIARQEIKVYVRRGGPRQELGLKQIEKTLRELDILGGVYDPKTSIPEAVKHVTKALKK